MVTSDFQQMVSLWESLSQRLVGFAKSHYSNCTGLRPDRAGAVVTLMSAWRRRRRRRPIKTRRADVGQFQSNRAGLYDTIEVAVLARVRVDVNCDSAAHSRLLRPYLGISSFYAPALSIYTLLSHLFFNTSYCSFDAPCIN